MAKIELINAYLKSAEDVPTEDIEVEASDVDTIETKYYSNQLIVNMVDGRIYYCDEVRV
jgi:hypothetical protein